MISASHYGLHRQDNLLFLHEQDGGRCVSPGLGRLDSPFSIPTRWWLRCPHRLDEPEPGEILDHPLVRAMSPDQEGGFFYVRDVHANWLWRLSAMTPGSERVVEPYWTVKRPRIRRVEPKLVLTNVAPLAFVDIEPADTLDIETLGRLPRLRNLVVCGPIKPPDATLLDPEGLDWNHDWAAEGRRQLHHLIRRQP